MGRPTRRELLQQVREHAARTGDPAIPWQALPALRAEFRDPDEVLVTLHRRWYARWSAHLDALLKDPPADLTAAVVALWQQLTAEDPAGRRILDAYRAHPALARADEGFPLSWTH